MRIPFVKYHGTGNDFILIDNRQQWFPEDDEALIAQLCRRRFGIGADGLITIHPDRQTDFRMVYFNADGKEGSMCGNGSRCAVAFANKLDMLHNAHPSFQAFDGIHQATINPATLAIQMADVPTINQHGNDYVIDTGSPHYIKFCQNVDDVDVVYEGRTIRNRPQFADAGINVNFVERGHARTSRLRTFERGVEAETLSCGTGAVAAGIVLGITQKRNGTDEKRIEQTIRTKGGELSVHFQLTNGNRIRNVWLEGPVVEVFSGQTDN